MNIKKIISSLCALQLMLVSVMPVYSADRAAAAEKNSSADIIKGDVDDNGIINTADMIKLISYVVGSSESIVNLDNSDFNNDGKIDSADVMEMNGLIDYYEYIFDYESDPESPVTSNDSGFGPVVSVPEVKAHPGEEFKVKLSVTDNPGYMGFIIWLDVDERYFEVVSSVGGDSDDSENEFSVEYNSTSVEEYRKTDAAYINTLVFLFYDMQLRSQKGDKTFATVTLRVKDDVPAGTYPLVFDEMQDEGSDQCNDFDSQNREVIIRKPVYKSGRIVIE